MPDIKKNDVILVRSRMRHNGTSREETRLGRVNAVTDHGDGTITIGYVPCYEDLSRHGIDRAAYLDMGTGGTTLPTSTFIPKEWGWQEVVVVCNLGYDPDLKWYREHQAVQRAMYRHPGYDPLM